MAESAAWMSAIYIGKKNYSYYIERYHMASPFKWRRSSPFEEEYSQISFYMMRPPAGLEFSKQRPVVIFGCSFAYGDKLNETQTISYKLANNMKRPVYNRAFSGWGAHQMLWQLENEPALNEIKDPEYIIYLYIEDHSVRLYGNGPFIDFIIRDFHPNSLLEPLRYKEKDGKLVRAKDLFPFMRHTALAQLFMEWRRNYLYHQFYLDKNIRDKQLAFLKLHMMESKKIINKKWPGAKIVVLSYESSASCDRSSNGHGLSVSDSFWHKMQKEGFYYINTREHLGFVNCDVKYRQSENDFHPREVAWDVIAPLLSKKLKAIKNTPPDKL